MKLKKFLCLFLLIAAVFALASCEALNAALGGTTTPQTKEFEVKFDSAGGSEVASQKVAEGGYVTEPKEPTKEGYTFEGWFRGGKLWDFEENTVTRAITLIAKWKKVSTHEHAFSDPTCTEPGKCECGEIGDVALGHTWVEATCDAPKTCSVCKATEGEAKGHTPGEEATCAAPQICTVCEKVLVKALDHTEVEIPAVESTCTTHGTTAGVKCSVCDTVIVEPTEAPLADHTEFTIPATEPDCTTPGHTAGIECSVCGEVIQAQTEIPANGHTEVIDAAVAPTCTETGLSEGKHCLICNEVLVAQTVVDALGHSYTEVVTPPTCEEAGYTTKTCSVCGDVVVDNHVDPLGHNYVDGVCQNCGETVSHMVYYYVYELGNEPVYSEKFFEDTGVESLYVFEKPGYTTGAWVDEIGFEYTSIEVGTNVDVHLYCSITAIDYTITYIVDGATHTTATYNVSETDIALIDVPAKLGFNAKGWADADGNIVSVIPADTIGDVTFTAVYEEVTYTITYVLNGGENHPENVEEFSPAAIPALHNPLTRDGYLFGGWYADAECAGAVVTSIADLPAGDITLYAKWTAVGGDYITPEAPLA